MKDYQQKRMKEFLLPEAVYRQVIWAARDLPRMKKKLADMQESIGYIYVPDYSNQIAGHSKNLFSDITGSKAAEIANLSLRIEAIEEAFLNIPEKYRHGIKNKLVHGEAYTDEAHPNTWRKWQQVAVYHAAKNLHLI